MTPSTSTKRNKASFCNGHGPFPRACGALRISALILGVGACASPSQDDELTATSEPLVATAIAPSTTIVSKKSGVITAFNGVSRAFDVSVPTAGAYYVRVWAMGTRHDGQIDAYVDGAREPVGSFVSEDNGFRYYDVQPSVKRQTVALTGGRHTISFQSSGNHVPEIEKVELSTTAFGPSDVAQKYADHVAQLAANILGPDHLAKKVQARAQATTAAGPAPSDNYCSALDWPLSYTFKTTYYFTQGATAVVETRRHDGNPFGSDPRLFLFSADKPELYSWANDDYNGFQSYIKTTIPVTGTYWILAMADTPSQPGVSDIYINNTLFATDAVLAGYRTNSCGLRKTNLPLNYFTIATNGADTMLWLVDLVTDLSAGPIRAFNDDFYKPGDFDWGLASRVQRPAKATPVDYAIVTAYSSSVTNAKFDVYLDAENSDIWNKPGTTPGTLYFPNLKAVDAIKSAPEATNYNCFSWSGGISQSWTDPTSKSSPWYVQDPNTGTADVLKSFDAFYENRPRRFPNAFNYTRSGVTDSNAVVDLWGAKNGTYLLVVHASVKKPGDNLPHGYDWESKPGAWMRTFHPRKAIKSPGYGDVVYSYRWTGTNAYAPMSGAATAEGGLPTLEGALASGLAVLDSPTLSSAEAKRMGSLKAAVSATVSAQFEKRYEAWKNTWQSPVLAGHGLPRLYAKSEEYKNLLGYCETQGKVIWPLLFEKHLVSDPFAYMLIEDLTLPTHDATLAKIREESVQARYTADGKQVVPSGAANMTKFIQALIPKM